MKIFGKMKLMTILKVTKRTGLHRLSTRCIFGKTTGGVGPLKKMPQEIFFVKKKNMTNECPF